MTIFLNGVLNMKAFKICFFELLTMLMSSPFVTGESHSFETMECEVTKIQYFVKCDEHARTYLVFLCLSVPETILYQDTGTIELPFFFFVNLHFMSKSGK